MRQIQTERQGILPLDMSGGNTLSVYTYLKEVEYHVKAHFEWNENRPNLKKDRNENKHFLIARRMLERGGRRDIFLGSRECQGYVEPCGFMEGEGAYDNVEEWAFGPMVHGITYPDEAALEEEKGKMTARFWNPVMKRGVIVFPRPEECGIRRVIRNMKHSDYGVPDVVG